MMGPNIYGFYYTPANLCATFCTAYDVKGSTALSSQSGGIGMAIIGFSRSAKMGVSAIVGLGNKSDIDEDDLLLFFEQDPNTKVIAQHCEDLKDGRAFAEVAKRVSKKKPVIMLKAGRTSLGAAAASSHTGALAGNDKIYDDVLRQSGVIRASRCATCSTSRAACRCCRRPRARTSSSSPAPAARACCSRTPASTTG
jgi:acyl-CoA synthetase (NDP forming)